MSTSPALPARHALGLPEGSIRTILAVLVVGLVCSEMLIPSAHGAIPPYLIYLLFLILGHFFAAMGPLHGRSSHPWPLHLPPVLVRLLIIGGLMGTLSWIMYTDPNRLERLWEASVDMIRREWYLPLLLLVGFFVGVVVRVIVGRNNPPIFIQDFEAWVSLIAVVGLCIAGLFNLVINPNLEKPLHLPNAEGFLAVVVVFYFGARS